MRTLVAGRFRVPGALWLLALIVPAAARGADEPKATLELPPKAHVALIGNTLADRMQHDGWLETYLQDRFPTHELTIRNLGFSGDELTTRLRSASFGTSDEWLTRTRADVIFAFFGYNESFAGPDGLPGFKRDLTEFLKQTLARKYNGQAPPRLVLFSPIAHEDLRDPNLPDGNENNRRLALYTTAMKEVAAAHGVVFVDLFQPTRNLYARVKSPLTINGIHLSPKGNRRLAEVIVATLFGAGPKRDLEPLRRAVLDKNFYWYNRYRTVDGYSIYGGRADLKFVGGQTNRVVMQREMEVLDVMTANRDRRVWAVAQGRDVKVDDSNTPPFIPVQTNKPGPGPNGEHVFLGGEEAIGKMTVAKGLKVNLFASEKEFPEVVNPVQMSFDPKGRLWVAVWPTYPHWKPKEEMNDKLLILEDTDGDGKADKRIVFADGLHCPTGFELVNGGVLLAHAPDLVFLKDTDGDDKADVRDRILSGLDTADTHHTANSFAIDPGGAVYFQEGTFHHTQVETPYGPPVRNANAGVYRYELRTQKFEVYVTHAFANPHGHVFDRWGQDIVVDGTGANPYDGALFSGRLDFPQKHPKPPQVYQQRTRPCPGVEVLSSRHFPDDYQDNLIVPNVIGFQGLLRYKIEPKGASLAGTEAEPLLSSSDPSFRPTDVKVGPDGAIYFLDWQNPIIGHMQHNLRDPSRDRTHGRIYRVTHEGRPLLKPAKIAGESIETLLVLLKEPELRVRYRARIELGARDSDCVVAAVKAWVSRLDKNDPNYEHQLLEALWTHQAHNVVDVDLLKRVLGASDYRPRAAATRVLCYWRDRVPDALEWLKKLAADPYPRVRLEAVRAASFFRVPEAVEVPLISAGLPTDEYLDYTRNETMKALEPHWKKALAEGRPIAVSSDAGTQFLLGSLSTNDLLKMKRSRAIDVELLARDGVRDEVRREAVANLAKGENTSELRVLLDAIKRLDSRPGGKDEGAVFDLLRLLTARDSKELTGVRDELQSLATGANRPVTRQLGFLALIAADGGTERAWDLASGSVTTLRDLVEAMPLIRDPGHRASLYPKVEPLLHGLPKSLATGASTRKPTLGRFIRIELPGRQRTLTLAEVEVISDGRNVARQGKASQKNTEFGGDARRAIDGNTSGRFDDGGQFHTQVGTADPWWEVDLGADLPIDAIHVYGRTDGDLDYRLRGYSLKVLDAARHVVFRKDQQPEPSPKAVFSFGADRPERLIRRAAMNALVSVRGREAEAFQALARFVRDGDDRHAAIQALLRIPAAQWPTDQVRPLLDSLLTYVGGLPTAERTSPTALDALQLADALAATLPRDQAKLVRSQLGALGVRIIRLGTVPDQMLFDQERLVVQAGKPVEIVFENSDLMPHNFVVTRPGALEAVGTLAEAEATQPGAVERHYVPRTDKVLIASRLLAPRDTQKLQFTAPSQAGVYPYVCTYPGHWRRMFGALYVVDDLDEYLADPEGYLAGHPLSASDELLKFNRPRKEWNLAELGDLTVAFDRGRSFANGKQMFQVANCVACHRLNGAGEPVGPDLTKLEDKWKAIDVLREVLDPSAQINEKYQTNIIATGDGKVLTGLVVEETPDHIKLVVDPLAKMPPVVLKRSDIVERAKSPNSIMPKGLLDKLTREEVLDLIAYVAARGDAKHPMFHANHEHGH